MPKPEEEETVPPCDEWKNDPVLKHTNVATAIDKLWELSGMDKHVNPANVKEYAAFLIPNGAGGYHTFILDDKDFYRVQTFNRIELNWDKVVQKIIELRLTGFDEYGSPLHKFPQGTIFVHTHPYSFGHRFSNGRIAKHPSQQSPNDEKLINAMSGRYGIKKGAIISRGEINFFNQHGITERKEKRC